LSFSGAANRAHKVFPPRLAAPLKDKSSSQGIYDYKQATPNGVKQSFIVNWHPVLPISFI
jgi:hypothetical protein